MKRRSAVLKAWSYAFLLTSTFIMIYPVLFMVMGSFTTNEQFLESPLLALPNTLNLDMLIQAFSGGVWESYLFTFGRCVFYIVMTLSSGLIGGYIFSKLRFPGRNKIFLLFLSGMVMPAVLMTVPMYLMMAWFPLAGGNNILGRGGHGFIGDWPILFLFGWISPLAILLLRQSFDMLPSEYEDAARMDGAGLFTIIFRVYGPLLRPSIAALVTVTFISLWNDYLWPSLTISGHPEWEPIALRIQTVRMGFWSAVSSTEYPAILMAIFLASWPPVLVYAILQRYFIQGLASSGLHG